MNNTAIKLQTPSDQFDVEPLLSKVSQEAEKEHKKMQEVFSLLGWGDLPDTLKIEIKDDVKAMVEELEGKYSTCDPYVRKRRARVTYWVDAYLDGICSLQTAIDALKVTKL
ncbi:MAG TPA: hypothetical protein VE868_03285 [Balneolaceae bacterium]|nr:hypothetical protein [Balneolaceae bacterium]